MSLEQLLSKPFSKEGSIIVVSRQRLNISSPGHAYDSMEIKPSWGFPLFFTQLIKQIYFVEHVKNGEIVVDLGCGKTETLEWFWRSGRRCSYVGIDYDIRKLRTREPLVERAKNIVNAMLVLDDFSAGVGLQSACADVVIFSEVIEHFPQNHALGVLSEIYRVLKPNGRLFITTTRGHSKPLAGHLYEYTFNSFSGLINACGFSIEKVYGIFTSDWNCLTASEKEVFSRLEEFYSKKLMRTILALHHPEESRSWFIVARREK